jgi:hypothetical protein
MKISVLIGVVLIISVMGCATTGPKYSTVKSNITPLSKEQCRIIFYRPDIIYGAGQRPDILLDGRKVGQSRRGTVFYVDVDPGKHQVTVPVTLYPGETTIDIELRQNETVYVVTYISASAMVGMTNVEVVNLSPEEALAEIDDLVFVAEPTK